MNRSGISLAGEWEVLLNDGTRYKAMLPGTLDENGIGKPDRDDLNTRLTRKCVYEGVAVYSQMLVLNLTPGERLFLKVERTRKLALKIDGIDVPAYELGSVSTSWVYELTPYSSPSPHCISLEVDNGYAGWPRDAIVYSSAATDETQTNWNGILGEFCLETRPSVFIRDIRVLQRDGKAIVFVSVDANARYEGHLNLSCEAFSESMTCKLNVKPGVTKLYAEICIRSDVMKWDEYDGRLYTLYAELTGQETREARFGIREIASDTGGRLTINGRVFFLRGETNCCVFPQTGHMPMTVSEWLLALKTYKLYGVNYLRFHSHCPPDAAFTAADEIGIMIQPELSCWDPKTAFISDESYDYYRGELISILNHYANHPSFVMLSLGNELHTDEHGIERMTQLLNRARDIDGTRLYTWGSNAFYGFKDIPPENDFYTSSSYFDEMLRATSMNMKGYLNTQTPASHTFDSGMKNIRARFVGPVFGFEVGQYEILPDFEQINDYKGVTTARNLEIIRERVRTCGLEDDWQKYVEATGELSLICYREEVEAVLRTEGMSGLVLLGLQDFPGQGTALVGMLDGNLKPKPYSFASPARFNAFFKQRLPLAVLPGYTFATNERPVVSLAFANYGRTSLTGVMRWSLKGARIDILGVTEQLDCPAGTLTRFGDIEIVFGGLTDAARLTLKLDFNGETNEYPIWVYPQTEILEKENVRVTQSFDETLYELAAGKRVLYAPKADKEHFPHSIASQFSPDFWSVGTFPEQEGAMGLLIKNDHPAFKDFPTKSHTEWQWWPMTNGRAFETSASSHPLVTVADSCATLRRLALLTQCRVGEGKLMICSMGLLESMEYPQSRALYNSLIRYMASDEFAPDDEMTVSELKKALLPD